MRKGRLMAGGGGGNAAKNAAAARAARKRRRLTHILESLLGAPPVTLATRRADSSVFRSLSCCCGGWREGETGSAHNSGDQTARTQLLLSLCASPVLLCAPTRRTWASSSCLLLPRSSCALIRAVVPRGRERERREGERETRESGRGQQQERMCTAASTSPSTQHCSCDVDAMSS